MNGNSQHPPQNNKRPFQQTSQERAERLSKTLCYLLRHGGIKEGLHLYKGGYFSENELTALPQLRKYTKREIQDCIQNSTSTRFNQKRFEMLYVNGLLYIKAAYGHSKNEQQIEELDFLPNIPLPEEIQFPE